MTEPLNVLSLFAGIGGLELGLERAGMRTVGQVELDEFCRRVLAKHWPDVPRHDDVRTASDWWTSEQRPRVDVICGGFPCQPVSAAGLRHAQKDPRWLWPAMAAVIESVRPEWVVGENVPGLRTLGLDDIAADLNRLGYTVRSGEISACVMGAPHARSRLFVLGHAPSLGRNEGRDHVAGFTQPWRGRYEHQRPGWWESEPVVARMANGVPAGVDRRRALGNAVVPQVAEHVGRLIVEHASAVAA